MSFGDKNVRKGVRSFADGKEYAAQAGTGALLNPRVDTTFKAMLTRNTSEAKAALKSFLEAATERKIAKWELRPNDLPVSFVGQRGVSCDISCEFDDGLSADIEMQAFNQAYDYGKRAEYQVARLEATYLKRGESWEKAPVVYQISILNFLYDFKDGTKDDEEKRPAPVSRFAMRTKDGKYLSNTLNIVFVELPKVYGLEESLETNTALENWAIFLKDADNPDKKDIIDKLTCKEKGLMEAQKSLSSVSTDMDLWWAEYRQEIYERDRISSIEAATKKGLAKGYEEGLSKGITEGISKGMKEGISKGMKEGISKGMKEGISKGMKEGIKEKAISLAKKYMSMGHSAKEAAEFAEIDESLLL